MWSILPTLGMLGEANVVEHEGEFGTALDLLRLVTSVVLDRGSEHAIMWDLEGAASVELRPCVKYGRL